MIKLFRAAFIAVALAAPIAAARAGESTWIYSVQLSAKVQASPPRVELQWVPDHLPIAGYALHRKAPRDSSWGDPIALDGNVTGFVDENVTAGSIYEYQVVKRGATYNYAGYGYISVAIDAPLVDQRGRVILVIDEALAGPLNAELSRYEEDLLGDGWLVTRVPSRRDESPATIKARIKAAYEADRERTRAVVLIGRVPIVRSGNQNVDGHAARPMPADVFYADMDGVWTDANTDGIYDQSTLPSDVELQIGRVDFADLPGTYALTRYPSEVELTRRYFDKNHAYRHAIVRPALRAIIGNQVGDGNGQAYAAIGYRNFAALIGAPNILTVATEMDVKAEDRWVSRLAREDFLWAYGNGAGSDLSVGNIGTHGAYSDLWSSDFIDLKPKGTFYLFFGSWFVDWAQQDNLLRSALTAPDYGLAAMWAGRPHLFFHAMGAGETLGQGVRASQNNDGRLYQNQVQRQLRGVHVALMGDPTLRLYPVAPPSHATIQTTNEDAVLNWQASTDVVAGYHVYRAASPGGPFTRLTESPIVGTRFVDSGKAGETNTYQVRAVIQQTSPSGSYVNASQGAFATRRSSIAGGGEFVWIDDALPEGAPAFSSANDRWNWVAAEPSPFSGGLAHRSEIAAGLHHHFFGFSPTAMEVAAGDTLFAYVYLDPANPPRAIMLTWCAEDWEHRAYWGDNVFDEGVDGEPGRKRIGPLPQAGQWVRLEVPAAAVNMEGRTAIGMGFTLFDGRATWDLAGKQ